ncbi:MAG: GNAT family N-acetyltransferase [Firmicutes bacterium]|nr:GNAT family N-acetyltransferase [Bacillota bacterium]
MSHGFTFSCKQWNDNHRRWAWFIAFWGGRRAELAAELFAPLCTSAKDFVPALSLRRGTTDKKIEEDSVWGIHDFQDVDPSELVKHGFPMRYYGGLMKQVNILLLPENERYIEGFMSFRHDYLNNLPKGAEGDIENFRGLTDGKMNYLSTVAVDPRSRCRGYGTLMYDFYENYLPDYLKADVHGTRTWGTNTAHLPMLKKRGYELVKTIKNDPLRGEGIDTVYYAKRLNKKRDDAKPRFVEIGFTD